MHSPTYQNLVINQRGSIGNICNAISNVAAYLSNRIPELINIFSKLCIIPSKL